MSRTDDVRTTTAARPAPDTTRGPGVAYAAVIGLAALAILLQGLWAGLFVHEGKDYQQNWVSAHARGADVAIVLVLIATVLAVWKLRRDTALVTGTVALLVLLVLEAYLGGLIGEHSSLTAIHFPLAMGLMGLAVWLPLRSRQFLRTR